MMGENHHRYKPNASYSTVHTWLQSRFGKASLCENYYCEHRSVVFQWALIKGKEYDRKRDNFWQLCKVCHLVYDKPDLIVSPIKL